VGEPPSLEALGGWRAVLGRLASSQDLSHDQARAAMAEILEGAATPAQIAGFAVALRMKGETVEELDGLLDAMLDVAATVDVPDDVRDRLVDVVGTGGDRSHTINVSTLSALVVAGAGVPVCKHGNRCVVFVRCRGPPRSARRRARARCRGVARCIEEAGIGSARSALPSSAPSRRAARRDRDRPRSTSSGLANPARSTAAVGVSDLRWPT
jgi:anthranilate phosphoribosyltransferase